MPGVGMGRSSSCGACQSLRGVAAGLLALSPFEGFGFVDPFDDGGVQAGDDVADFGGAGAEELPAQVDQVEAPVGELVVQVGLQAYRVVAEDHGVHVIAERDGGITELTDPVHRVEAAGHADLDDVFAERADVGDDVDGDDVDVAGADVSGAAGDAVEGVLDLGEFGFGLVGAADIAAVAQCGDGGLVVGQFLAEPFLLPLVFAAGDLLLAEPGAFFSFAFFLLGDLGQVVGGQLQLFDPQPVVGVGDHDVHRAAQPGDGLPGLLQPGDRGVQGVGLHRGHRVLGLFVVGTQHQLGELPDHLGALRRRPVDRPVRRALDRGPGLDRVFDPGLDPGQPRLVRDRVIQRVPVLVNPGLLQHHRLPRLHQLRR